MTELEVFDHPSWPILGTAQGLYWWGSALVVIR